MATIYEVAKLAGVSPGTVSNVLNHTGKVAKETEERILQVIRDVNYVPNRMAQGLKTNNSKNIFVIVEDIKAFPAPYIVDGVSEYCYEAGYNLTLFNLRIHPMIRNFNYNDTDTPVNCTLAFRVPGWCTAPRFTAPQGVERSEKDGYVYFTGIWHDGDAVMMDFPMEIRLNTANSNVRENLGKAAVTRGPICYCMEETDNGTGLHLCRLDPGAAAEAAVGTVEIGGQAMLVLKVPGFRREPSRENGPLYSRYASTKEAPTTLKFVPYYAWANRGEGEMRVWVRV